jgi:averantin hydroxylase
MALARPPNGVSSILGANHADHSRFRRLLSHAFSDKGIREQDPLIRQYVDLLIQRLHEHAGQGSQDMVDWYTWTTFDVIGDLAFGEPFNCLRDVATHPWIALLFGNLKAAPFINAFYRYGLSSLVGLLAPKKLLQSRKENYEYSATKIDQRLESKSERFDFWDKVLIHNKEGKGTGMTRDEMVSNASLLILAGSETTATLLSGATYLLLKHPDVMAKLITEIRTTFKSSSEIDLLTVGTLKYMLAVLDETMRLYPPVTSQPNRVTPRGGEIVCGKWVAEGVCLTFKLPSSVTFRLTPYQTSIAMQQYASNHLESNFHRPDEFLPQRWLGDVEFGDDKRAVLQPFAVGPRNCIGRNLAYAEMRLILAKVLFNFDLELDEGKTGQWLDQKVYILWEKNPLWVRLKPVERA